jgi:glyoxylase-like metal-dependent hydrolase (beta-lactamase superfamily II)
VKLWSIEGNRQRLDGGAMFGNAPRALWQRWSPPDEQGRIPLACRALVVDEGQRRLLFETGVGAFFPPHLRERYGVEESRHVLLDSLAARGWTDADIDVVVLSHLHFDHAGGLLAAHAEGESPRLLFPRARFVVSAAAWERASTPHPRDRASFIDGLTGLLQDSGRLEIVEGAASRTLGDAYRLHFSEGHTPGLMLAEIPAPGGPVVYASDLVPGRPWVHLPITMGYDRFAERLIDEKRALLERIRAEDGWMFFTHDAEVAAARVAVDDRGRFCAVDPQPSIHWT